MSGLFERVRRMYLRAVSYPVTNPEWTTDTARCAAQCGRPLVLGEDHYTVTRSAERVCADGVPYSLHEDELAYVHIDCWPDENGPVVIESKVGGPDWAGIRRAVTS